MKYDGMCCSCFLCVSAVCFFLKIPLCFLPLTPPGVRHFTMEPSWKSISFSLHISYHILAANIPLRVEKFSSGWLGGTQLFSFPVFCHSRWTIRPWKEDCSGWRSRKIVMLDTPVFWIPFCGFSKNFMLVSCIVTAQKHNFKPFPGFLQRSYRVQTYAGRILPSFSGRQTNLSVSCFLPLARRNSLAPVTHRDHPCCPFSSWYRKMYHEPNISARWPDVKQPLFSENWEK